MSTPLALIFVLLAAGALTWLSTAGKQPRIHSPLNRALLDALLDALLYRGVALPGTPPAQLTIVRRDTENRVVLTKYRHADGRVGIRAVLDPADWDAATSARVHGAWQEAGLGVAEEEVGDGPGRLAIDIGHDLGRARLALEIVFERVASVHLATACLGYFNEHLLPTEVPRLTGIARAAG